MRGFRGSRAAQNFNSRSGRSYQKKAEFERLLRLVETPASEKLERLPDWMKTPETLAQEKEARPKLTLVPKPKAEPVVAKAKAEKPKNKASSRAAVAKSSKTPAKAKPATKRKPAARSKSA
jgi:hypothetical protein